MINGSSNKKPVQIFNTLNGNVTAFTLINQNESSWCLFKEFKTEEEAKNYMVNTLKKINISL